MAFLAPRFYPILDVPSLQRLGVDLGSSNSQLAKITDAFNSAGAKILQLRDKDSEPSLILARAESIAKAHDSRKCQLILNDRPDLALLAGFDGCHLGQQDLSVTGARTILPQPKILGLSTHNAEQVETGNQTDADYLAIGPIFATSSKQNPDPVLGLEEFRRLRKLTTKPVVAIGGITRDNARAILDAGADSVAIIGDLYRGCTAANFAEQVGQNIRDILAQIL
jgi:thiamine-phosphate pyrophosphorylase